MVQIKDTPEAEINVEEYNLRYIIHMHCRKCNGQFGFLEDVEKVTKVWLIKEHRLFNMKNVAQFLMCMKCSEIIAERHERSTYKINKKKIMLKHIS